MRAVRLDDWCKPKVTCEIFVAPFSRARARSPNKSSSLNPLSAINIASYALTKGWFLPGSLAKSCKRGAEAMPEAPKMVIKSWKLLA